jgi:AGCS family alanine or glycine:cation symporter
MKKKKLIAILCISLAAVLLLATVGIAVSEGVDKIQKITAKVLPLTTVIYMFMTICVIFANFSRFGAAAFEIFSSALSLKSVGVGVGTFVALRALREGYCVGVLSNEAGVGTSSFAHSRESGVTPCEAGVLGAFEVVVDTSVLCMLTALAIILAVPNFGEYASAMRLVCDALSSVFSRSAPFLLSASVFLFAFSTVVCWFYYGEVCRSYLFASFGKTAFRILFFSSVAIGVFLKDTLIARLADTVLLLLSVPTLFSIIKNSDRIVVLSEKEGLIKPKKFKANEFGKGAVHPSKQALRKPRPRSTARK